jgi:DNA-directed RNA polymerase specialized sigma subunit
MVVKKKNYLNNASLIEEIMISKKVQKKNPNWTPAQCMTPKLVGMLQMLVDRYSQKANWRGYTYIDDMRSEAIVSLMQNALKFNPEKSQNPFGYYTQIVTHSFLTFLDKEKKVRRIKDTLMEQQGFTPSHARQLEYGQEQQHNRAMAAIYPEIVESPQLTDAEIKEMSKKPKDSGSTEPKRRKRATKKGKKSK